MLRTIIGACTSNWPLIIGGALVALMYLRQGLLDYILEFANKRWGVRIEL
jgi:hypothetical protein